MAEKEIQKRRFVTILWRIENLSLWEVDSLIETPEVFVHSLNNSVWLVLYPRGEITDQCIDIVLEINGYISNRFECECSILDSGGFPLITGIVCELGPFPFVNLRVRPTLKEVFISRRSSFLPNDTLTVRCRIWQSNKELAQNENFSLLSRIQTRGLPFLWPIKNFSSYQLREKKVIDLNSFCPKLTLGFLLRGKSLLSSRVGFQITAPSRNLDSLLRFQVSVMDTSQKEMHRVEYQHILDAGKTLWSVPAFVSRQELLDKKSGCLNNDVLTLKCKIVYVCYTNTILKIDRGESDTHAEGASKGVSREIIEESDDLLPELGVTCFVSDRFSEPERNISIGSNCQTLEQSGDLLKGSGETRCVSDMYSETERIISTEVSCQTVEQSDDLPEVSKETRGSLNNLSEDFLCLYQDQTFSDFELRSNEVSFQVHKNVLSARSPVFRAMFSSGMKEAESSFLDVPDVDPHTLNRMLTFLYTGTVELEQWEVAAKVYYAADKYDVSFLKQICRSTLSSNITMSNVCDVLVLADRHQDQELMSNVRDFILGDFDEIMQSKEWRDFMERDPILAGKTTHQILTIKYQLSKKQNKV